MGVWFNLVLGLSFLVLAFVNTLLMYRLWGYPYDKARHRSSAPRSLVVIHRATGYAFVIIYIFLMSEMLPRLWQYQIELPARDGIKPVTHRHHAAQRQHAQTDRDRIVVIGARNVNMRATAFELQHQGVDRRLEIELAHRVFRMTQQHRRNQRNRQDGGDTADRIHQRGAERRNTLVPLPVVERTEVETLPPHIIAH